MECITDSSGVHYHVFNTCPHEVILTPIQPLHSHSQKIATVSAPPRAPHRRNSITYGSTVLQPYNANAPLIRSSSSLGLSGSVLARKRASAPYDPINDPHLRDYFERKFNMSSAKRKRVKERKPGPNEVVYRVKVKTGNCNNASTDANVYLTICGKRADLPKKHLFNKYNAIKVENGYKFRFERNSDHVFKIIGLDVGQIQHIIIEHDGKEINTSWFLQEITITNTKTHRVWLFECNDWLSLDHGLGKTRIQLQPSHLLEKYTHTDYQIATVTGDKLGAGTDANVYITLFGPNNKRTPRLHLKNPEKGKELFGRGRTDLFKLSNVNYVGPLVKVRIEHDNTGSSPGWFLDRVVVTDLKNPKVNYFCPCSRWLDKNEDDGLICRDLPANDDPLMFRKMTKYKVTVLTGDKRGAGTDADVSIVLYGNLGDSGEWKLNNKTENNFERGMKDEFLIECLSVGEIKKLRIGHNNKGSAPGWFLSKVIVDDLSVNRVYDFNCERWLAEDEEDGKTTVFLYPGLLIDGDSQGGAGVPYVITVHTGDKRNAGTDAKVYIEMFGGRRGDETSGRIVLKDGKFERKRVDKLNVESPLMLSPISALKIGHDNSGGSPGWYLSHVEVYTPSIGMKQVFPCDRWLAKDEEDGKIERILKENTSLREERGPKNVWEVSVYTSNKKNAGTDANVFLMLYGDRGKSDEIPLQAKGKAFESGQCDKFVIETDEIGQPFKLRVWHDNKGTASGWHLDRIELENQETKERYYFICNRWLAKDEDDHQIVRELPAEGDSVRKPLPIVKYIVETHTGNKAGAGTNADVFINLFGDFGDTGERWLEKSETHRDKFERDHVDVFKIEAVSLKHLKKVRIGHTGKRAGAGWFLKKVVVKQEGNPKYDQEFECNRWLAVDEDDGLIVRELFALGHGSQFLDTTSYHVKVKTGDVRNAGTDAHVNLKIFGAKGDTGDIHLKNSENTGNKFERGREDLFKIEAEDIGKIEKIQIGHNGKGPASGWFLDYVEIDVPSKGYRYKFSAHRWLDKDAEDGKLEVELYPTEVIKLRKTVPYVITTKTGDKRGAGTDANVFIQFYGPDGKSEEIPLDNRSNNFERGQEDVFKIEAEDVGPIYKVRIGHDNKGGSSGWFLERMHIQRYATKSSKNLRRHSSRDAEPEMENYYFFVNRWFARDEDDKQIVRELIPTDEQGRPLAGGIEEIPYEVKVTTGDKRGAGTDANVFVTVYGLDGDSGERELRKSEHVNKFERGQTDTFIVKAVDLGELQKIKIRHDNKGGGAAWYLEKVEINDPNSQRTYLFNCQNWLSTNEGDGKISRELPAIDPAQLKRVKFRQGANSLKDQFMLETEALTNTYNISVVTSDLRGAGTNANVYIQLFGEKNDSGKIPLELSKTNRDKFERGQTDVFEIKEADVGDIRKIRIGHDGKGAGAGWHLKEVIVDAPKLGKKWRFACGRWLDKGEDDGKIERELFPMEASSEEYVPFIPYEITVFTSDLRGADTSANPYIVIYGDEIRTKQMELCKNRAERRDKFKRGAVDKFVLEMEDVGERINKIRLGHDNKGLGAGWHVDKVEIRRLRHDGRGSKIYVFPCRRWLARDEDDKAIERDLVAEKLVDEKYEHGEIKSKEKEIRNRLEMKDYIVEVFTGDVARAGTNADVFLTMYGEFGDSGEKKLLKSETHMNKFERNQMDRFVIQTADLGPLFKVDVRHNNGGISPHWFLDRIEITDQVERVKYQFLCERWLSKSKEDKQIARTLFEKNYKGPKATSQSSLMLKSNIGSQASGSHSRLSLRQQSPFDQNDHIDGPTQPYKIVIRTGDEKHCGISSQAFIRLYGDHKRLKTDRIMLQLAKKKRFEPGSSETFQVEGLDIGELKQIELGHDGVGASESWFVKHVEVTLPLSGKSYFITCNQWLSTEKGDGLTVRKFNVDEATSKITSFRGLIPYAMTIYTGDLAKAGTDSNVTVKVFGTKGNSEDIFVEKIENRFDRAAEDTVMIELDDIGSLKKIRVSHDGKGSRREWFLDRVELTNMRTKKQYVFVCQKWLSKGKEGLSVDIPLFKHGEETIGQTDYKITVKTSNITGAGTDANVFVSLFGPNGDSGELELKKSETNTNKFEKNKTDVFVFKGVLSLGELTKLRVRHDNSGNLLGNAHWHLEYIEVEDLGDRKTYRFDCNKWLSVSKDDKQLVRELVPTGGDLNGGASTPRIGDRTSYEVIVQTADRQGAGTKQNIELTLIGDEGQEIVKLLENNFESKILRRGQADRFVFKSRSIGTVRKIALRHVERLDEPPSREDRGASWLCDQVTVKDVGSDTTYMFTVREAFGLNDRPKMFKCDSKRESSVNAARSRPNIKYEVTVVTGNEKGAATNAHTFITLYGENGDSGKRPLKKGFDRNETAKINIECIDLGQLRRVHVEHDNTSFKKDWFLDRIEILDTLNDKKYVFPCNKWLSKSKEDGEIGRDLFPQLDPDEERNAMRSRSDSRSRQRDNFYPEDNYKMTRGSSDFGRDMGSYRNDSRDDHYRQFR